MFRSPSNGTMKSARLLSAARILGIIAAVVCGLSAAPQMYGQAAKPRDVQDAETALQLFNTGKYDDAAKLYAGIPEKYPTSALIPEANFRLGYIQFLQGKHDEAVATLEKNSAAKNVPPDILELSQVLVPQILTAKASKLDPTDPARKAALEQAVKRFDEFINKFPQSEEVETANYGKSGAHFELQQYEQAAAALRANMQRFPQSPSALDTQFRLALVLGTQANVAMQKATAKDPVADAAYDEALRLLADIIGKRTDIAVSNDAQFQLGEILSTRGALETDPQRKEQYLKQAIDALRAVLPKEEVVRAQQARLIQIQQAIQQSIAARNIDEMRRRQRFLQREQEKLATFEQRADQTLTAKLKTAQILVTLGRYDGARVVLRFVDQFAELPEQKKQILYLTTVTYAAQNLAEKAVAAYDKFMAAHKGDVMGENLPLIVGLAFLGPDPAKSNPETAIKYFKEQGELYPKSRFTAQAVMQQALAMIPLKRYDEAESVLKTFLAEKPEKDLAAVAEFGLASIYKETNKADEAVKTFKAVRDNYAGTPQAEQAAFWIGQMALGRGDWKGASDEFQAFITKFPESDLAPAAMLSLGDAQASSGDSETALKTYKELSGKHPQSEPAKISYFKRARVHQDAGRLDDVRATMREFIASYPEGERLYSAFDYIAQVQIAEKQPLEAIKTYEEFIAQRPADPHAATAYLRVSSLWKKYGEDQGPYLSLNEEQRSEWEKGMNNSTAAAEQLLEKYPDSPEVALALQNLIANQRLQIRAKLKTPEGEPMGPKTVEAYFQGIAAKFENNPAAKSKVLFALAGFVAEEDKPRAVEIMASAYNPEVVYAPTDLDLYGSALIEQKKYDEAQKVFDKLAADYPLGPNMTPDKASRAIGEAQSIADFGRARILQEQGKTAEAQKKFEELKKNYGWSSKLLEADYGIAEGLVGQKKHAEAIALLANIGKRTDAPAPLRARAMLLLGKALQAQGKYEEAINNFIKIARFFEGVPEIAAEGLWLGAQLQEKQASGQIPMPANVTATKKGPAGKTAVARK